MSRSGEWWRRRSRPERTALLTGLVLATVLLLVITVRALRGGSTAASSTSTTIARHKGGRAAGARNVSSPGCQRLGEVVGSYRGGSRRRYTLLLHRLQANCPREARKRNLDGSFLPPCQRPTEQACTTYSAPRWFTRPVLGSASVRVQRGDASHGANAVVASGRRGAQAYLATIRSIPVSRNKAYTLTAYLRAPRTGREVALMQFVCFNEAGAVSGYGRLASLGVFGPSRVVAPADTGSIEPTQTWQRFGGVLAPRTCAPATVAVRPQFLVSFPEASSRQILLDAVQVEAGVRPTRFTDGRRNLVPDGSFEFAKLGR